MNALSVDSLFRDIEKDIITLDTAISTGQIDPSVIAVLKDRLKVIAMNTSEASQNERYYLLAEMEGLIAWIEGRKRTALHLMATAVTYKGDAQLYSGAARGIAGSLRASDLKRSAAVAKKNSYRSGLLGFFYFTVIIVFVLSLLVAVGNTMYEVFSRADAQEDSSFAYSVLAVMYTYLILSAIYVFGARTRRRAMRYVAASLFLTLVAGCIVSFVIEPGEFVDGVYTTLVFAGLAASAYYLLSSRVRFIFNR